jgi:SAM-dependent methyltransferase
VKITANYAYSTFFALLFFYFASMKRLYHFLLNSLPRPLLIRLSYVFRLFAPLLFRGKNVQCTVCKKSFSKFLPYGSKVARRENVLCPNCLSLERHRWMWTYLKMKTDFFSAPKEVLHIAPEQCFHKRFKKQANLKYITGDLVSPIADYHFDLHQIPFDENRFEVIFCNHVLEHVEDEIQCMRELHRVMKPGGWGIFQVPVDYSREETFQDPAIQSPEDREKYYWQKDHVRLFGKDYPQKLQSAGFRVEEILPTSLLSDEEVNKHRFQREEVLYVCHKD